MKFIEDKYDSKNGQLKFYPKVNQSQSTQPGRYWKDKDGFEVIEKEESANEFYYFSKSIFIK